MPWLLAPKRKFDLSSSSDSGGTPDVSPDQHAAGWAKAGQVKKQAKINSKEEPEKVEHLNLEKDSSVLPKVSPTTKSNGTCVQQQKASEKLKQIARVQIPSEVDCNTTEKLLQTNLKLKDRLEALRNQLLILKREDTEKTGKTASGPAPVAPEAALQPDAPTSEKSPGEAAPAASRVERPSVLLPSSPAKRKIADSNASNIESESTAIAAISPERRSEGPVVFEAEAPPTDSKTLRVASPKTPELNTCHVPVTPAGTPGTPPPAPPSDGSMRSPISGAKIARFQTLYYGEQLRRRTAQSRCKTLQQQVTALLQETAKLKSQLQTQNGLCALNPGSRWQFETDVCWQSFTPEGNEKMLQAYLRFLADPESHDKRYAIIHSGGVATRVDFVLMEQEQLATHQVRKVRLLPGAPPHWGTAPKDLLQQSNDLDSYYREVTDCFLYEWIHDLLRNTGHANNKGMSCSCMSRAKITSVHRIENLCLWHRYKARLSTMRQDHARYGISVGAAEMDLDGVGNILTKAQSTFDCGDPLEADVDEKILLHGTSWDNANSIVREGFDHRACQTAFYGAGVYFASAACKSHQYTCKLHKSCCQCLRERTMIIARVALGDSYVATGTRLKERRPPLRSDSSGTYDSIVVKPGPIQGHHQEEQIHQEYVIFDREQAYPCYVVQYTV